MQPEKLKILSVCEWAEKKSETFAIRKQNSMLHCIVKCL